MRASFATPVGSLSVTRTSLAVSDRGSIILKLLIIERGHEENHMIIGILFEKFIDDATSLFCTQIVRHTIEKLPLLMCAHYRINGCSFFRTQGRLRREPRLDVGYLPILKEFWIRLERVEEKFNGLRKV